jgi:hypothetical protein
VKVGAGRHATRSSGAAPTPTNCVRSEATRTASLRSELTEPDIATRDGRSPCQRRPASAGSDLTGIAHHDLRATSVLADLAGDHDVMSLVSLVGRHREA